MIHLTLRVTRSFHIQTITSFSHATCEPTVCFTELSYSVCESGPFSLACESGQQQPNMAEHHVFDFFGLPRELRDAIYDHLGVDVEVNPLVNDADESESISAVVRNVALTSLLTLNGQFKAEYEQQLAGQRTLLLYDTGCYIPSGSVSWSDKLRSITKVEVRIIVSCDAGKDCMGGPGSRCQAFKELQMHQAWIRNVLTQLPMVQSVCIKYFLAWHAASDLAWSKMPHGPKHRQTLLELTNTTSLRCLEVYPYSTTEELKKSDEDIENDEGEGNGGGEEHDEGEESDENEESDEDENDKDGALAAGERCRLAYEHHKAPVARWTPSGGWEDTSSQVDGKGEAISYLPSEG